MLTVSSHSLACRCRIASCVAGGLDKPFPGGVPEHCEHGQLIADHRFSVPSSMSRFACDGSDLHRQSSSVARSSPSLSGTAASTDTSHGVRHHSNTEPAAPSARLPRSNRDRRSIS